MRPFSYDVMRTALLDALGVPKEDHQHVTTYKGASHTPGLIGRRPGGIAKVYVEIHDAELIWFRVVLGERVALCNAAMLQPLSTGLGVAWRWEEDVERARALEADRRKAAAARRRALKRAGIKEVTQCD